jgi:hypothetical protein
MCSVPSLLCSAQLMMCLDNPIHWHRLSRCFGTHGRCCTTTTTNQLAPTSENGNTPPSLQPKRCSLATGGPEKSLHARLARLQGRQSGTCAAHRRTGPLTSSSPHLDWRDLAPYRLAAGIFWEAGIRSPSRACRRDWEGSTTQARRTHPGTHTYAGS